MTGPLQGLRFVEMAGIGPAPFAAMMLADLGATGIRVESPHPGLGLGDPARDITRRGRASRTIDARDPLGRESILELIDGCEVLIEGFRPGVMERLGLGPQAALARNPRLVYGRITGWGQDGPWSQRAGHDITYIALAGVLAHVGRVNEPPTVPLNLVGDYGGGAMLLVTGILAALWEAERTGQGQVVDAAMVDGAASLMTMGYSFLNAGLNLEERGVNMLDTGAPFYEVYETKDGRYFSVGAIEPQFYAELLDGMGLAGREDLPRQMDRERWGELKALFAEVFATKTRDEWTEIFINRDACAVPVLSPTEAAEDAHMVARGTFARPGGVLQPGPAPRFSRTPSAIAGAPRNPGADTTSALADWGIDADRIASLRSAGALA